MHAGRPKQPRRTLHARVSWPKPSDADLSSRADAAVLARRVRQAALGESELEEPLLDLRPILQLGRFRVCREPLIDAGLEALLVPAANDSFEVVVDPQPALGWGTRSRVARADTERHRLRFRIGHEIAHSFFYARIAGECPKRLVTDSPAQEDFCDAFASALLLPTVVVHSSRPEPRAIVELAHRFDVSIELSVRAFAETFPSHRFALLYANEMGELRPQWFSPDGRWPRRWWSTEPLVSLARAGSRASRRVRVSATGLDLAGIWIAARRQALLVGRSS
jgi:IrrE N-terminal-like domain